MSAFLDKVDRFFGITEKGSSWSAELRGGLITFLAMAYILAVNPSILSPAAVGYSMDSLFTATALAAAIACIIMAISAKLPIALAPGMGINAFVSYTVCIMMGFTYPQALLAVLISGVLFFIVSVAGVREKITNCIPKTLKLSITAGIGFFIAVVGLFNAGIIVHATGSALQFGDLADPMVLLSLFCLFSTLLMFVKGWWGATIVGMILTAILGLITGLVELPAELVSHPDFTLFGAVFTDFEMFDTTLIFSFIVAIISLLVVDVFDSVGTYTGLGEKLQGMGLNEDVSNNKMAYIVDSGATVLGAAFGTSTTTAYIESGTGIVSGAKTGLSTLLIGLLFVVALFFSPVFTGIFGGYCTVGALVLVGVLMMMHVKDIEWNDNLNAVVAFLTIFIMGLSGSITNGIAAGIIGYVLGSLVLRKMENLNLFIYILFAIFVLYFVIVYGVIPNI